MSAAIYIENSYGIRVEDCVCEGFEYGVHAVNSSNIDIKNFTVNNPSKSGVKLDNCYESNIKNFKLNSYQDKNFQMKKIAWNCFIIGR